MLGTAASNFGPLMKVWTGQIACACWRAKPVSTAAMHAAMLKDVASAHCRAPLRGLARAVAARCPAPITAAPSLRRHCIVARASEFQSSGDEEGEGRSPAAGAPQVPDPTAPGAPALPTPFTSTAASLPPPPTVTALLEESTTATSSHRPSHEAHSHSHHGAVFEFACPICQTTSFKMSSMPTRSEGLRCGRCSRTFNSSEQYIDLTVSSGAKPKVYERKEWAGTELFRSPLVSFAYERGWRQGFSWAGFPGVDKEFDMAMDYLRPAYGSVLVDMSCGSGLFSRRFAQSGKFSGVVAADFSESMLQQARAFFKQDGTLGGVTPVTLLRADVGRLPFPTGSVAAIHAGAAIHCWPNPQAALAEISRVLRPGGVFVASTFMVASAPLGQLLGSDDLVRPLNRVDLTRSNAYKWWEEDELRDLCSEVGLQGFKRTREWRFIMFAAKKPGHQE